MSPVILVAALSVSLAAAASPAGATAPGEGTPARPLPSRPSQGAASAGDRFYPTLGNGGYDVRSYDLSLAWSPPDEVDEDGRMLGEAVIEMVSTQDLSGLSLDLARTTTVVTRVSVDGLGVVPRADPLGRKLIVPLPSTRTRGTSFTVRVTWSAVPGAVPRTGEDGTFDVPGADADEQRRTQGRGFIADGDGGALLAAQPNGAHTLFPSNDHPTDKARLTVRLTAPAGMLGVAGGTLRQLVAHADGGTTSVWSSDHPVATHVVALAVGRITLLDGGSAGGVPILHAVPQGTEPAAEALLAGVPAVLEWLQEALGRRYPFERFGLLVYPAAASTAILEGQSLVLFPSTILDPRLSRCSALGVIVHEAAHQWFGDSVSIAGWDQKWLSEGHATYWEWRWRAANGCEEGGLGARMRAAYRAASSIRELDGPPGRPRRPASAYTPAIYDGGALVLHALRKKVGATRFAAIERRFLSRHRDGVASTDDLIAIASAVGGRDLGGFLRAWLYGSGMPAMPGHPGWTSSAPEPAPARGQR